MNRSYIFETSFEALFTHQRLHYELLLLKLPASIHKQVQKEINNGKFFGEEPKKTFFIPKDNGEFREVSLSSPKTKIIQRVLATSLSKTLHFSDRSYAFQKGKSPYNAIMKVQEYMRQGDVYMAKADIEQFFDHIDQVILMKQLERIIKDRRILHLIAYYVSQGYLDQNRWVDKNEGIYQGDVLSPLLSNIYLNDFDFYLEKEGIHFVRYSDDILFLAQSKKDASAARQLASKYLKRIKLRFNPKKTYLSDIENGFEYLGLYFHEYGLSIDTQRITKKVNLLKANCKKLSLNESIEKLNEAIVGFKNYYNKLIDDNSQIQLLQNTLDEIITEKIVLAKRSGTHSSKHKLKSALSTLQSFMTLHHTHWVEQLIKKAYTLIALEKPLESGKKQVVNEKRTFLKKQLKSSELIISTVGAFIGFSQGKIKVKLRGKIVAEVPIHQLKRILLLNRKCSLSAYLVYECSKRKIDIDFIDKDKPYAMLTYYHHVASKLHQEQLKLMFSPRGVGYAKKIAHTKSLNQINLLKYHNRRQKNPNIALHIQEMSTILKKIKKAKEKKSLMGLEGQISVHYWSAFGELVGIDGFIRTHQNSLDEVNQALNYGYAILYNRVQSALIHEGLNLHYPLYHASQSNKPTMTFDMIEEFRQPVVDREVIAMLRRGEVLHQLNGKLSKESIKKLVQHIQNRLAAPTLSRYGKTPLYELIHFQMNHLKRSIIDDSTYRGFVNKY